MIRIVLAVLTLATLIAPSTAKTDRHDASTAYCNALAQAVTSAGGGAGPVFVRSYEPGRDEAGLPPALASTAFVYDDALAAIALVACGDVHHATLIGDALSAATRKDRTFADGRIRNAYRAGRVDEGAPLLPGWWDDRLKLWAEDPAQDGTSTGNVAWAALALLTLHQATANATYLSDAERLLDWIIGNVSSGGGFQGGFHGYDPQQAKLSWMSTEHNADVYAVASWLFRLTAAPRFEAAASEARNLLDRTFQNDHFLLGTKNDGSLADGSMLALDVQLWPWMAAPDGPAKWRAALDFAAKHLSVDGGFDFNGDRDGLWVEGTAQASLAYRIVGNRARGEQLLNGLEQDRTKSGLLNATRQPRLTTGLSLDPTGGPADFFYFRRPHIGATAWATLAAEGWNPFLGRRVD